MSIATQELAPNFVEVERQDALALMAQLVTKGQVHPLAEFDAFRDAFLEFNCMFRYLRQARQSTSPGVYDQAFDQITALTTSAIEEIHTNYAKH